MSQSVEFYIHDAETALAVFAGAWEWFTSLAFPFQIVVSVALFFLIWGVASLAYNITKLALWVTYKVLIYTAIGIFLGFHLVINILIKLANQQSLKIALDETAAKAYGMVEAERNVWPFVFEDEKTKVKA